MQVLRTFVLLVGVTLSVTPIFSSAWAQQRNSQSDTFQEIQALRAEIAELRDMIERQQFQMRKLQQAQSQGGQNQRFQGQGTQAPSNPAPQQYDAGQYNTLPTPDSAAAPARPADGWSIDSATNPSDNNPVNTSPANTGAQTNTSLPTAATTNVPQVNAPGTGQTSTDSEFYQPYQQEAPTPVTVSAAEVPVRNIEIGSSNNGYPPVEERVIGSPSPQAPVSEQRVFSPSDVVATGAAQAPISQPATNSQVYNSASPSASTQATAPATSAVGSVGAAAATGVGVISVPNSQVSAPGTLPPQVGNQAKAPINAANAPVPAQTAPAAVPTLSEQDYYQQGFDLLKQSKHQQAVDIFKQQIASYPEGDLVDDAHYWIAESMYVNRDLDNSKGFFRTIIDSYAQSPRLPDAMLKTAYIEQEQGNEIEARILLQEIIQYHPRSNAAISAKNRLAELSS